MQPNIIDIRNLLPFANTHLMRFRQTKDIKLIAVHYDAVNVPQGEYDPVLRYIQQAQYHIDKNWAKPPRRVPGFGLMYHYRISADGRIWKTQAEELITWHVTNANDFSLGVCLDLGDTQKPTKPQLDSLRELLDWLCWERPDLPAGYPDVYGHKELKEYGNNTDCPGEVLPYAVAYRNGKWGRAATPEDPVEFVPETGFYIGHGFRELYHKVNAAIPGLFITGYPITNEELDDIDPSLVVQYFENGRMEWKPGIQARFGAVGRFYLELKRKGK